jgi:RND family efflux transporter MFP subunit
MNSATARGRHRTTIVVATRSARTGKTSLAQGALHASLRQPWRRRKLASLGMFFVLVGTAGYVRHQSATSAPATSSESTPLRQVTVATPSRATTGEVTLPATVQAYQATDLFARANGYLKAWHADIGSAVKAGQVLAEIETPELDQELAQAVASLAQGEADHQQAIAELEEARSGLALAEANVAKARANLQFSIHQSQRSTTLLNSRAISREEYDTVVRDRDARDAELASAQAEVRRRKTNLDTRQAIIGSRQAVVRNREANVQRLRDLTGFHDVVAPFDAVVTRRHAEVGMLVTAGSNSGTQPLFSLAQVDVLRVQAAVPQSSALKIKAGDAAQILVPERPGQVLTARVSRTAGAVEPRSRSLLVEVELPNPDRQLLPGIYAQIRFAAARNDARWTIPVNTVLTRNDGSHVIVVGSDGAVHTRKITLGRDTGARVEALVGLQGDERLVVNPASDLPDGQMVQVAGGL